MVFVCAGRSVSRRMPDPIGLVAFEVSSMPYEMVALTSRRKAPTTERPSMRLKQGF